MGGGAQWGVTSRMSQPNATKSLEVHLYNDLRWLLCAATEWHVQQTINPDDTIRGQHIKLYAMDSAALHARALLEFFTNHGSNRGRLQSLYGIQSITSNRYPGDWVRPLNTHLMHAQDRTVGQQLTSFDGKTKRDLNRMPVDFGREVVSLWRQFVQHLKRQPNPLDALAQTTLDKAIANSALVVSNEVNRGHGVSPIAW
jgi:hypothetical protein